ncbi:hypothetical protein LCM23_12890 [Cytobacillus kochii]|uniref:hypothetical protein n=1 Tax=Cytobacillus kochii TaxID=859143 RepID=UPI001CD61178|nr:hypothetical protein [Cytobacillus kochii]MCA1026990.1 hypothetical protein [Cytobacillus kochii]
MNKNHTNEVEKSYKEMLNFFDEYERYTGNVVEDRVYNALRNLRMKAHGIKE